MTNNELPEYSGAPWNTDDLVFGKITCQQLATLTTGYIGTLRMARSDFLNEGTAGVMKLVVQLLNIHLSLLESHNLSKEQKKIVDKNCAIALQSICLAALYADTNNVNPRHLAFIGNNTLDAVHQLTESVGPIGEDDEVMIQIRKKEIGDEFRDEGEDAIEMALSLQPITALAEEMLKDDFGKEIKRIVKGSSEDRGDQQPGNN